MKIQSDQQSEHVSTESSKKPSEITMYYDENIPQKSLESLFNKNTFLRKVSLYFIFYGILALIVNFILLNFYTQVKQISDKSNLMIVSFIMMLYSIKIRIFSLFKKEWILRFKKVFIVYDSLCFLIFNLSLFIYLDSFQKNQALFFGHYVFIFNYLLIIIAISYSLSVYFSPLRQYDWLIGILFTNTSSFIGLLLLTKIYPSLPNESKTYFCIALSLLIFNFYLCLNSYFILKRRSRKFDENDDFTVFLFFSSDWLWRFEYDFLIECKSIYQQFNKTQKKKSKRNQRVKYIAEQVTIELVE